MNLHPLLLSVAVVDTLGVATLALASATAVRVVLSWKEGDPSRSQLALERKAELASATARLGLVLHAIAWVLTLLAINHVLPAIVPGAMCGFGAVQALPDGRSMLLVRVISLLALVAWLEADRADRATPTGALTVPAARALLVATPIAVVSAWQTIDSLLHVDVQSPVSCCSAVFDLARSAGTSGGLPMAGTSGVVLTIGGAVGLVALATALRRSTTVRLSIWAGLAAGAVLWSAVAAWTLVDVAAPYVYGVLGHRCPFCLMLPSHGAIGYVAYGALAVVLVDAIRTVAATRMGRGSGANVEFATRTSRRGLTRMIVAIAVFLVSCFGPVLLWKLRHGVWLSG